MKSGDFGEIRSGSQQKPHETRRRHRHTVSLPPAVSEWAEGQAILGNTTFSNVVASGLRALYRDDRRKRTEAALLLNNGLDRAMLADARVSAQDMHHWLEGQKEDARLRTLLPDPTHDYHVCKDCGAGITIPLVKRLEV